MSSNAHLLLFSLLAFFLRPSYSKLIVNYYEKKCPQFQQIMRDTITNKQIISPTTAAATLLLFLHDCLIDGCDSSVLVTSTAFNTPESDADINLSLPGDGFDVVVHGKTALELACPNTVSCAYILAVATRDLLTMVGGPCYDVRLGRKDSFTSKASLLLYIILLQQKSVSFLLFLSVRQSFFNPYSSGIGGSAVKQWRCHRHSPTSSSFSLY